jgi:hypothetical protein
MGTRQNLVIRIAVLGGGAAGLGAEWLSRPSADRHLYLAAFTAAWLAMGVVTILTGQVSWERESGTHWYGMPARILGVLMSLTAVVMYFGISSLR